jgi:FkbM family methyltransferase
MPTFLSFLRSYLTHRVSASAAIRHSPAVASEQLDLRAPWEHNYADICTTTDIYYCFRLLLGRPPSKGEWPGHSSLAGGRLKDVVSTYLDSPEFKNRQLGSFDVQEIELCEVQGFKLYVPKNDPQVGRTIYLSRMWESQVTDLFLRNLRKGDVFVDVGGNIGYFSMLAASRVGSHGRVFTFEPFSQNVKLLHLSRQANAFEQIEIFPIAASLGRNLYLYDNLGTNGYISPLSDDFRAVMQSTVVFSLSVDELLKDVGRVDFMKMDVEGAEHLVLRGARNLVERHQPVIVTEFAPPTIKNVSGASPIDFLKLLLVSPEYKLFILDAAGVVACDRDVDKVLNFYEAKGSDHIDLVSTPKPLA